MCIYGEMRITLLLPTHVTSANLHLTSLLSRSTVKATTHCTIFIDPNEPDDRKGQNRGVGGGGGGSSQIQSWTIRSRREAHNARKLKIQHVEFSHPIPVTS